MDAEAKLCKVILKRVRETDPKTWDVAEGDVKHMHTCLDSWVEHPSYMGGICGEGTCEYTTLQAVVVCPHNKKLIFAYESWDTIDELFEEMDRV